MSPVCETNGMFVSHLSRHSFPVLCLLLLKKEETNSCSIFTVNVYKDYEKKSNFSFALNEISHFLLYYPLKLPVKLNYITAHLYQLYWNSKCVVQSIYCGSFKSWKTCFSLQFLQLPDYIGQGNLPKGFLHIGHTCYATHHWLTFDVFYLYTPTLLIPPPSVWTPLTSLFCTALLSCFVPPLLSPLRLLSLWIVIVMERLIRPAYGCHRRQISP